jgi:hypothetical protein
VYTKWYLVDVLYISGLLLLAPVLSSIYYAQFLRAALHSTVAMGLKAVLGLTLATYGATAPLFITFTALLNNANWS